MYEVMDHICAHVKLVYCVTIVCVQSDLFLWHALKPMPMCSKEWWKWNLKCMYVRTYVHLRFHIHIYTHTHTYVCTHVHTFEISHTYACTYVCMCMHTYICECVCVCVCVCVCARVPEKEILIVIKCRLTFERNKARQKYGEFAST